MATQFLPVMASTAAPFSSSGFDSGSSSEGEDGEGPVDKEAARAARKAHKKATKEANRERRKAKMPKHVKKKHEAKGKTKKK